MTSDADADADADADPDATRLLSRAPSIAVRPGTPDASEPHGAGQPSADPQPSADLQPPVTAAAEAASATAPRPEWPLPGGPLAALIVAAALIAGLIGALVVAEVGLARANALSDARNAALATATTFSTEISSYDYHHLDHDFKLATDHATARLRSDITAASARLEPVFVKYQATAVGRVVGAGVSDATTDRATVVVLVDQTLTNSSAPTPRLDRNRLVLTLTHSNAGWLVDRVDPK
jgi:Mce-associated membrane protein